jgi:hypothetical protein
MKSRHKIKKQKERADRVRKKLLRKKEALQAEKRAKKEEFKFEDEERRKNAAELREIKRQNELSGNLTKEEHAKMLQKSIDKLTELEAEYEEHNLARDQVNSALEEQGAVTLEEKMKLMETMAKEKIEEMGEDPGGFEQIE